MTVTLPVWARLGPSYRSPNRIKKKQWSSGPATPTRQTETGPRKVTDMGKGTASPLGNK